MPPWIWPLTSRGFSDIVGHDVSDDLHLAGFGIDLDLADMAAIGEACLLRRDDCRRGEAIFTLIGNARGNVAPASHLLDANGAVSSGDAKRTCVKFDVRIVRFKNLRDDLTGPGNDLFRRAHDGRSPHHERARAESTAAMRNEICVAGDDADSLRPQP